MSQLRLLEWGPLTPELARLAELSRVTRTLRARGNRIFVFSYHSSSLLPGNNPYVRSDAELTSFLYTIEQYIEFCFGEIGGISMTPSELRALLLEHGGGATAAASTTQA